MRGILTVEEFNELIVKYSKFLEKGYLEAIQEATDKDYAKNYYQNIFFLENEMVPYASLLFKELSFSYDHFSCLNSKTAYVRTFELLPQLKLVAKKRLREARQFVNGNNNVALADWYIEQLEKGWFDLEELLEVEQKALSASSENLTGALAIHLAGRSLIRKYRNEEENISNRSDHPYKFTQKEQTLSLYFLLRSFGINTYQMCDRTKLAALFHLIMGVPFTSFSKLKNLSIYSSLGVVPLVVEDKQLMKYLQNIRPYFNNAELVEAVKLIDEQIKICESNIKGD